MTAAEDDDGNTDSDAPNGAGAPRNRLTGSLRDALKAVADEVPDDPTRRPSGDEAQAAAQRADTGKGALHASGVEDERTRIIRRSSGANRATVADKPPQTGTATGTDTGTDTGTNPADTPAASGGTVAADAGHGRATAARSEPPAAPASAPASAQPAVPAAQSERGATGDAGSSASTAQSAVTAEALALAAVGTAASAGGTIQRAVANEQQGTMEHAKTQVVRGQRKPGRSNFHAEPVVGWLVVIGGPGLGAFRPIFEGNNAIGRAANQRIPVDFGDDAISNEEQAYVRYDPGDRQFLFVPNLAKTNVVSINDAKPTTAVRLHAMDVITMGQTQLVFVPFCGDEFDWSELADLSE